MNAAPESVKQNFLQQQLIPYHTKLAYQSVTLAVPNTPPYYATELITAVKSFMTQEPRSRGRGNARGRCFQFKGIGAMI